MTPCDPIAHLPTHEVTNMPPHMGDQNLWQDDQALRHWTKAEGKAKETFLLWVFGEELNFYF